MTPKEKAIELVDKMSSQTYSYQPYAGAHYVTEEIGWEAGKKCALIAVDDMLGNAGMIWGGRNTETGLTARDEFRKYWQEVKQEIEKL